MENGIYTIFITPFCEEGRSIAIDYNSIDKWIKSQYVAGIKNLVLHGSTAENLTLTKMNKIKISKHVYSKISEKYKNPINIYIGIDESNTYDCIDFAKENEQYCNGFIITYHNSDKTPQQQILNHFKTFANAFPTKLIIMSNYSEKTGLIIEPETAIDILNHCPNIIAIKESTGDINYSKKIINLLRTKSIRILGVTFKIFTSNETNIIEHIQIGGSGAILVSSNAIPKHIYSLVNHCLTNNYNNAQKIYNIISDFVQYLYVSTNTVTTKEIMFWNNVHTNNIVKLPLLPLDSEKGKMLLEKYNNLVKISEKL